MPIHPAQTSTSATVVVTGGAGYVGAHACKALRRAGYQPVVYDNLSRGHRSNVKWGELIEGDLFDDTLLRSVLQQHRPVAVIHFAAFAYVGESNERPDLYYRNNIAGTQQLLQAMKDSDCRRLVFSSSCAVYGGVHQRPIDETTPCTPASTYGFTKLACERLIADYARAFGFTGVALRYFNAAGADPDGDIGEDHDPEPHIVPTMLRVAAGLEPIVRINGDDHPTPDGTCVRDFTHVSDLASAHVSAMELALIREAGFEAFNLGTGSGTSLKQIAATASKVTGVRIPVSYGPRRLGDPPYAVGDSTLARQALNWSPRFDDIETIVSHAWKWMKRDRGITGTKNEARYESFVQGRTAARS